MELFWGDASLLALLTQTWVRLMKGLLQGVKLFRMLAFCRLCFLISSLLRSLAVTTSPSSASSAPLAIGWWLMPPGKMSLELAMVSTYQEMFDSGSKEPVHITLHS